MDDLDYQILENSLLEDPLFDSKTWRLSPQPWWLTPEQLEDIKQIGSASMSFYFGIELLYRKSYLGKSILRNQRLLVPWIAQYLDHAKPSSLIKHARSNRLKGVLPPVLRPDLLVTEQGFVMTELDAVPGGIGLTAQLNRIYQDSNPSLVGGGDEMLQYFYDSLVRLCPKEKQYNPVIAIVISEEATAYRPEMDWLVKQYRSRGYAISIHSPEDLFPLGNTININQNGSPLQVDLIYRFWELFDLATISWIDSIWEAWEDMEVVIAPAMRPFQEEKLNLALFHHPMLENFWKYYLSKEHYKILKNIIPQSWILDPRLLPPHGFLNAPKIEGKPIWEWSQIGKASKKERQLVLKRSGFHPDAWGSRSVVLGHDVSQKTWEKAIQDAKERTDTGYSILQDFHKPIRLTHPLYGKDRSISIQQGRVRLCPYYFPDREKVHLGGVLASFCPADKKIIHGMSDAAMLPCGVRQS